MANLGQQFDASQVQPSSFDVIPKGDYILRITDSDVSENSAKTGNLLKLTMEVVEGQYQGRKIFDQLNLSNPNEMAVKIGRERLSGYCHATGVIQLQDSQQLHGIPFIAKVKVKVDKNGVYDDKNEIVSCKKLEAGQGFGGQQQNTGMAQGGFTNQGGAPAGFGGAPAGFGGQAAQNGFQPQGQQVAVQGGGYGHLAGQQQNTQQGFQPQGQAHNQGTAQLQGQGNPAVTGQVQQVVDSSPVPEMGFGGQQPNAGMAQGGFQPQQNVDQGQQAGFAQGQPQQNTQQAASRAPWEQG